MDVLFQLLINTLITGSVYGVMAMSFALACGTGRFFNLAHGSMGAVGAYAFLALNQKLSLPAAVSFPAALLVAGLAGFLIDRYIYAPQRRRKASATVLLVVSLGVLTMIEALLSIAFGPRFYSLDPAHTVKSYQVWGVAMTQVQLLMIIANVVILAGLLALLYKTKFGRMLRAISDDPEVARILGIRTDSYIGWMYFTAAALAAVMGILFGLDTGLQPTLGFYLLLKGVIAAIIGGVTSIPGAFLGAFLLAAAENTGVWFFDSEWRDAIAFTILLVFLLFRPEGMLRRRKE
jgi:branched-chain amino acid transport system permease protein